MVGHRLLDLDDGPVVAGIEHGHGEGEIGTPKRFARFDRQRGTPRLHGGSQVPACLGWVAAVRCLLGRTDAGGQLHITQMSQM